MLIILCTVFFGCEAVATLFHGERPEPPTVTYTITFDANGATGNPPAEITVTEGGVINLPNIGGMVHSGNTFVGWSESATIGVGTTLFVEDSVTVTRNMVFYAQWVPLGSTQYTISFNANDASGAPPSSKIVYAGVQIIIPDKGSLAYAGKMFGGWNTEKDGSGTLLGTGTLYTVSGSITLYAQWYSSTDSFTVTFHTNGGNGAVPSPQTVTASSNITLPNGNGLSKDGFIFGGWNTSAAGTGSNYAAGYLYTVTGTITLYATWNSFFASVTEVSAYLASQSGGYDPDEPVYLPVEINLGNMTQNGSGWRQLLNIVASSGKYVELDLSGCTMTGTEFNPDNNVATGKDMIVSITLPDTATSIANRAFLDCTNLARINLPTGLTTIGIEAFYGCTNLALTELPVGITSIGNNAFDGCINLALTSLPTGLTSIGHNAFHNCTNLALTSLPAGITSIGSKAFQGCTSLALTSLPVNLTSINDQAFDSCTNLALTSLPAGITSIGSSTFSNCTGLALTSLPAGVTSIGTGAFQNCTNLALTSLPAGLKTINYGVFQNCTNLALTSLPAGITSIGIIAFENCTNLALTSLPAELTFIGNSAFENCTSLTSLSLPASVDIEYANPFMGCTSLSSFTVTGTGPISVIGNGKALVRNSTELIAYPTASGSVILPEGITSIGYGAFKGCTNLTQITFPASITSIGEHPFWDCYNLAFVILLNPIPPTLGAGFSYFNSNFAIKVPAASVAAYKAASGWSVYADGISAIE